MRKTSCAELPLIVPNDQGVGVMDVTENLTATLRAQEHGHQPIVLLGLSADREAAPGVSDTMAGYLLRSEGL